MMKAVFEINGEKINEIFIAYSIYNVLIVQNIKECILFINTDYNGKKKEHLQEKVKKLTGILNKLSNSLEIKVIIDENMSQLEEMILFSSSIYKEELIIGKIINIKDMINNLDRLLMLWVEADCYFYNSKLPDVSLVNDCLDDKRGISVYKHWFSENSINTVSQIKSTEENIAVLIDILKIISNKEYDIDYCMSNCSEFKKMFIHEYNKFIRNIDINVEIEDVSVSYANKLTYDFMHKCNFI